MEDYTFINYGDINPLAYNGLWIRRDSQNEKCFDIVKVVNLEEACGDEGFLYLEGYVNLEDDWINWENVLEDSSNNKDEFLMVCDLLSYYSGIEFGNERVIDTMEEVLSELEAWGIEDCLDQYKL